MEMATRIFDQLFSTRLPDDVQERIADELTDERRRYWRRVVRLAGLLHDVGHLPFSHAAEEALLPEGWNTNGLRRDPAAVGDCSHLAWGETADRSGRRGRRGLGRDEARQSGTAGATFPLENAAPMRSFAAIRSARIGSTISCAIPGTRGRVRAF